jgi:DNA polymerase delta subunit 2
MPVISYMPIVSQRFIVKDKNFERQYSHVYVKRLVALKPAVETAARKKWGRVPPPPVSLSFTRLVVLNIVVSLCGYVMVISGGVQLQEKLVDLRAGDERVCVGTIIKDMKLKPSVLDEYADEVRCC